MIGIKLMKSIFFVSMLCLSLEAYCWVERGNGGNSIICDNPLENKFYDTYEAEFRYGLNPIFPETELACSDERSCLDQSINTVSILIDRLPRYYVNLKEFLYSKLAIFVEEANFLDNIILLPVDDIGTAFIPKGCQIHQTVIQKEPKYQSDKRYMISNDQWKKLSPNQQAAGILHELLYYYAITMGGSLQSSEGIRFFNSLILSNEIKNFSKKEYAHLYLKVFKNEND